MTMASKPVRFIVAGNRPPKVESKKRPVSGDLLATQARLLPGTVVSVMGPTLKTTALAGANGSVCGGARAYGRRAAGALPPPRPPGPPPARALAPRPPPGP